MSGGVFLYELYEEVWHGAADGMSVTGEFPDPVEAGSTGGWKHEYC